MMVLAGAAAMAALVLASTRPTNRYHDDTHDSLRTAGRVFEVRGQQPLERVKFTPPTAQGSVAIDSRRAIFTVANSRNPNPTAGQDCDHGTLPVNRYPLVIEQHNGTAVVGGLFLSRVPLASEWQVSYCNSAAITFEGSANGVVDGVRITGAWDAIRVGRGSPNLRVINSWISNARDDAVENDFLQVATIRDTLIEGAFQGVSVKPRKSSDTGDASDRTVTLSGVLLHLREYDYKGERRFGALTKSDQRAPRSRIVNSVVAVDYRGGQSYPTFWATSWTKLTGSSNNLFLWLSDSPIPDFVPLPPASFRVVKGAAARDAWSRARSNWINCHPRLARLPSDPRSNPDACIADTWGGFTQ